MGPVNLRLVEQARSIFAELGYSVEGSGSEFTAERDWKVVTVSTVLESDRVPRESGQFHCFIAEPEDVSTLESRLTTIDPDYEWAIIVVDGEDYQVERAPPGPKIPAQ